MGISREVQDLTPVVADDEKAVQNTKRERWDGEEIHCSNCLAMVSEERQPSLHGIWISRSSPDPREIFWKKGGKKRDDIEFMGVWFSHSLEPDRRACCFEAHQAERGARVKLLKIARESDLQGFNLLRNPRAHLAQPSWFGKWTFTETFVVIGESPEGIANPA